MDPLTIGALFAASNPGVQQGVSNLLGKIPILGGIFGGGQTDAEKALVRRQQQMAEMVRQRQQRQALTAPQLQGTAQQMLAFDPLNRAMASMHGPGAAFTPQQMANMVQNPNPFPGIDEWARQQNFAPTKGDMRGLTPFDIAKNGMPDGGSLINYQGTDPEKQARIEEYLRQKQMYEEAERRRRETIMNGFQDPGAGPAPLGPRAAPAPVRKF